MPPNAKQLEAWKSDLKSALGEGCVKHPVWQLIAEVERLRALMPAVYGDGYQAGVDGDESDVLDVVQRLDEYLANLPRAL